MDAKIAREIFSVPQFVDFDGVEDEMLDEHRATGLWAKIGDRLEYSVEWLFDHLPLRQLGPILVLILYTVFGGWMFRYLETTNVVRSPVGPEFSKDTASNNNDILLALGENLTTYQEQPTTNLNFAPIVNLTSRNETYNLTTNELDPVWVLRKDLMDRLWRIEREPTISMEEKEMYVREIWAWYDRKAGGGTNDYEETPEERWNMWNAMFYAATLYTTIGYGHIAPSTTSGRIATMVYALVGIPLVLTILSNWGNTLFQFMQGLMRFYVKLKHRKSIWVPMADLPDGIDELPVSWAVFLLIFWLCSCAAIFMIWEDWSYFTSLYFFFISLTTIGLGDVVPHYPKYTLMAFILVLMGLSVVSMSFNIIQVKIENVFKSMMLGIEQEYWNKLVDPEVSQFSGDQDHAVVNASVGVMQLWKKKPLRERILFRLMDKSKKDMLKAYWEKKANTKNEETQTPVKTFVSTTLQVDMEEEEYEAKYKNRKYVYNLGD